MKRDPCTFLLHWRASPVLTILPTGAGLNRWKITVKTVFAYMRLVVLTESGWPVVTDDLDGDLARLQQWTAPGRVAPFAHAPRVAAPSRCGGLPGVGTSAVAAVRYRGKASGFVAGA